MTLPLLAAKVAGGEPITWLTCYDYPTAVMQDAAGVDMILVGDSLGMTMLGFDSTLPVTMDDMVRHTAAVRRGAPNAWLIGDMPYMSYQPSVETAIRNAGRLIGIGGQSATRPPNNPHHVAFFWSDSQHRPSRCKRGIQLAWNHHAFEPSLHGN
jgi:3-methyl-2-oxobutanoate hydroxymethyltransferase